MLATSLKNFIPTDQVACSKHALTLNISAWFRVSLDSSSLPSRPTVLILSY